MGPVPDDRRNIPSACYKGNVAKLKRVEPGLYLLKIGTTGASTPVSLVIRHNKAKRDPLLVAEQIPDGLTLKERRVTYHFPMLDKDDVWNRDSVRQGLFLKAPKSLFVFPKYDLDAERARFRARVGVSSKTSPPKGAKVVFPKANEPLLAFREGLYVAADGNIFGIHPSDLGLSASGRISLPKKARNPGLSFSYSANSARVDGRKAETKILAASSRAHKAYLDCDERIWKRVNPKLKALERGPYSEARQRRISSIEQMTRNKADKSCKAPYDRKQAGYWKRLMAARTQRRTAVLKPIRVRLLGLFKGR